MVNAKKGATVLVTNVFIIPIGFGLVNPMESGAQEDGSDPKWKDEKVAIPYAG